MQFKYYIRTKVFFGKGCMFQNKTELCRFGRKALIVTGGRSAKESGVLSDICNIFDEFKIEYGIFDRVENNPSLETVTEGGKTARDFKADFIVGIGGGSPLDAAKAIAVLAVNDMDPTGLYSNTFANKPLPIIAIPTTAGTGSEVTPYSVLTRKDLQTKMSFGNEDTFPALAFMDAAYTESMPYDVTVNTAIDALCHAIEGYLSRRSTPVSDLFAIEAVDIFRQCLDRLINNNIDFDTREKLLYMAMLGGMVISHTGTTIIHGMGYSLTFYKDIPHGRANGLLLAEYLKFNYDSAKDKIDNLLKLLGKDDIGQFGKAISPLLGAGPLLNSSEVDNYSAITMQQRTTSFNIRNVTVSDIANMYKAVSSNE